MLGHSDGKEGMLLWGLVATGRGLRQALRRLGEQRLQGDSFLRQLIASALLLARSNLAAPAARPLCCCCCGWPRSSTRVLAAS